MLLLAIPAVWFGMGVLGGMIGETKGAGCLGFILGIALGPIGLLIIAVLGDQRPQTVQVYVQHPTPYQRPPGTTFSMPPRGYYEPPASIDQKRRLELIASSKGQQMRPEMYSSIDSLGKEQAEYVIAYCNSLPAPLELPNARRGYRILPLMAIAAGILIVISTAGWVAHSSYNKSGEVSPSHAPSRSLAVEVSPTPYTPPPAAFASDVRQSQQVAMRKHPDLAVAGSAFNGRFVSTYKLWQKRHDPRLDQSDWPERLADDIAR